MVVALGEHIAVPQSAGQPVVDQGQPQVQPRGWGRDQGQGQAWDRGLLQAREPR